MSCDGQRRSGKRTPELDGIGEEVRLTLTKRKSILALVFLLTLGLPSWLLMGDWGFLPGPAFPDLPKGAKGKRILLVGDTQQTLGLERFFLFREQNTEARKKILQALSREEASLLVILGDLVGDGASTAHWKYFDQLFLPIKKKKIPVLAVFGNHDYWGPNSLGLKNFSARFPQMGKSHWFLRKISGLGLIFLDTNQWEFSEEEWNFQKKWLQKTQEELEKDPEIKGYFVLGHHPPYTNSKTTSDEVHVQPLLKDFMIHKKSLAYISGHAHGYEHFFKGGKHFIVSGGGGGPRVHHYRGKEVRHRDLFKGESLRPFHYLLLEIQEKGVQIEVKGFDRGEPLEKLRILDRLFIGF